MDRERLDLSISSIKVIHSIIDDIENGEDVGYNGSIISDLEYAVECIKDVILGKPSMSEPEPIQSQEGPVKNTWIDTRKSKIEEILKLVQGELANEDFQEALQLLNDYFSSKTKEEKGHLFIEMMAARENVKELVSRTLKLLYKYEPDLINVEKSELYDGK